MRKLILTCDCGQRMQVPRSAIGKMGLCPNCGRTIPVTSGNTSQSAYERERTHAVAPRPNWWQGSPYTPSEDAKQRFGQASDLFRARRYGQALAIFNALAKEFPGNPEIERGRSICIERMRQTTALPLPGPHAHKTDGSFDGDTVRQLVLEKMLHGGSEEVQIKAAELAAKLLGLLRDGEPSESQEPVQPPREEKNAAEPPAAMAAAKKEDRAADDPDDAPPDHASSFVQHLTNGDVAPEGEQSEL